MLCANLSTNYLFICTQFLLYSATVVDLLKQKEAQIQAVHDSEITKKAAFDDAEKV